MTAPRVVTSVEELAELYADLGTSQIYPHLSVLDADGRPWIIWDTEYGDWLASSLPMEDDGDDPNGWSRVDAESLAMPVTVLTQPLTPAPTNTVRVDSLPFGWDGTWRTQGQSEDEGRRVLMTWTKKELVERYMQMWQFDVQREGFAVTMLSAQVTELRAMLERARNTPPAPVVTAERGMDMLAAFDDTVRLAADRRMVGEGSLILDHLLDMQDRIDPQRFSRAKLGRWLGWAQAALVAANVGVTLDDVKEINLRHSGRAANLTVADEAVDRA